MNDPTPTRLPNTTPPPRPPPPTQPPVTVPFPNVGAKPVTELEQHRTPTTDTQPSHRAPTQGFRMRETPAPITRCGARTSIPQSVRDRHFQASPPPRRVVTERDARPLPRCMSVTSRMASARGRARHDGLVTVGGDLDHRGRDSVHSRSTQPGSPILACFGEIVGACGGRFAGLTARGRRCRPPRSAILVVRVR